MNQVRNLIHGVRNLARDLPNLVDEVRDLTDEALNLADEPVDLTRAVRNLIVEVHNLDDEAWHSIDAGPVDAVRKQGMFRTCGRLLSPAAFCRTSAMPGPVGPRRGR